MPIELMEIISCIKGKRFDLNNEKATQEQIYNSLSSKIGKDLISREFILDNKNIVDFLVDNHYAIEVKIRGATKKAIYKQCERYCKFTAVKVLVLASAVSMGFPQQINGKDCYFINLNSAWL